MSLPARAIARCQVEDVRRRKGGQWYGGPGGARRLEDSAAFLVPVANAAERSGAVWIGEWADRREGMTRNGHWPRERAGPTLAVMRSITPPGLRRHTGLLVGGAVLGTCLVVAGLGLSLLVVETPFASRLVPASVPGSPRLAIALLVWTLALSAGVGLLVAGASRLAITVAAARSWARPERRSSVLRALGSGPVDVVVTTDVALPGGRPIPELVIGPFGVVVVHEMGPRDMIRGVGRSWETRTADGWAPTEHPVDRVARDAERVRHWLSEEDLDFVVRVYAALVTPDVSMPRSPLCAVVSADQIPAWLAALPRQRSLSSGRRRSLQRRLACATTAASSRRG